MPVTTHVRELFRQRLSYAVKDRSYETSWQVWKSDGGRPLPFTASEALDAVEALHPLNSTFPGLSGVKLTRLEPQEVTPNVFHVTGAYSVLETPPVPDSFEDFMQASQQPRSSSNPHGPKITKGVMIVEEYDFRDLKGKWFTNSAGDPLQQLVPIPVNIKVRRVTLNVRDDPDDGQVGLANGRRLFADVQSEAELHLNKNTGVYTPYWVATYEMWIHTRRDWVPTVVWDAGYNELGDDGKLHQIIDPRTDEPFNSIRLLNGKGKKLGDGVKEAFPLEFTVREEGQFTIPFLTS